MAHTPAVAGDVVFIGSCNGIFRALDRRTGQVRWETRVGPESTKYFFHGDPLVTTDLVIVGADTGGIAGLTGNIHAFERSTGRQRWTYAAGRGVAAAIVGVGKRAYATRLERQILALDVSSGALHWSIPVEIFAWEAPAAAGDRLFVGARDGSLSALNAETGRVEWRTMFDAAISTSVSIFASGLYVGTADGTLHRVAPESGTVLVSRRIDGNLVPRSSIVATADVLLVLLANRAEDYLALVALDTGLEGIRWRRAAEKRWSTSRVFVWNGAAIVGSPSGEVVAYCASDGSPAWSRPVRGTVRAVGGTRDALYVSTTDGSLSALGPVNGCKTK